MLTSKKTHGHMQLRIQLSGHCGHAPSHIPAIPRSIVLKEALVRRRTLLAELHDLLRGHLPEVLDGIAIAGSQAAVEAPAARVRLCEAGITDLLH